MKAIELTYHDEIANWDKSLFQGDNNSRQTPLKERRLKHSAVMGRQRVGNKR